MNDTAFDRRMADLVAQERASVHAPDAMWASEGATNTFPDQVWRELRAIGSMLIAKNAAYGNSALDPVRIFSRADRLEQLKVRIDDKLSRIARAGCRRSAPEGATKEPGPDTEDTVRDLIGYLVLLRIAEKGQA